MYVPDDLSQKLSSFCHTKILENKENRPKIMGHDKCEHINSEKILGTLHGLTKKSEKSRASLGKKFRNF